jgi:hypothetical protein
MRLASCLVGCALASSLVTAAGGYEIEVSLNVRYDDPADNTSGGEWEIFAKSSDDTFGIYALSVNVLGIDLPVDLEAPRGNVNVSGPAGFALFNVFEVAEEDYYMLFASQEPRPSGQQGAFYGVGRFDNGSPIYPGQDPEWNTQDGSPNLTTLSNVQGLPWAEGDTLGDPNWDSATMFFSGTFSEGVTPSFVPGHIGHVFTSIGDSTMFGMDALADITPIVRTNFQSGLPDYNKDGFIDVADFVVWAKGIPDADSNGDNVVDMVDYDAWADHFGETAGPGGGGSIGGAVPEPSSLLLVVFGLPFVARRRAPTRTARRRRPSGRLRASAIHFCAVSNVQNDPDKIGNTAFSAHFFVLREPCEKRRKKLLIG